MNTLKIVVAIIYILAILMDMVLAVIYNIQGDTLKGVYYLLFTILLVLFLKD